MNSQIINNTFSITQTCNYIDYNFNGKIINDEFQIIQIDPNDNITINGVYINEIYIIGKKICSNEDIYIKVNFLMINL